MKTKKGVLAVRKTAVVRKASAGVAVVDPQALLSQAIAQGLPEVSMRELFAMRREMEAERAKKEYFKALAGFQNACPVIAKAKKVPNKKRDDGKDPGTKYAYAPIEDIVSGVRDLLNEWGFSFTFKSKQTDGMYTSICVAHHKDGHEEQTEFTVPTTFPEYMNMSGAQMQGAACTYADRYAFKNAFGIVTKGDDTDAVRPEEERKTAIRQPQEKGKDAPVPAHAEVKLTDYEQIINLLKSVSTDPKTKMLVAIFSENERTDYTHQANEAKGKPEELKVILKDIMETGAKRHKAIKGDA